jgi:hypothetical protein
MKIFGFEVNRPKQETPKPVSSFDTGKYSFGRNSQYNWNEPIIEVVNDEFVAFGQDNMYPNHLNELFYSSPFHSSITNFKVLNLIGGGVVFTPNVTATEKEKIELAQWKFKYDDLFLNQLAYDYIVHSRICHKVYWNEEHTKIVSVERIDPAWVRSGKKIEGKVRFYVINPKWGKGLNRNKSVTIPAFDNYKKDERCQLYVYQGFSPGLEYYSQPVYANAANWIFLDGEISFYHKSNIENSLNPSIAIKIYERPANEEEKQSFIRQLQASFGGAGNTGKAMVFYSNGKELSPDIQSIEANTLDEAFAVTQEMIIKNIAFSHTIDPVIMGISTPGALGQSQQLETAYTIFKNTFVFPTQRHLNTVLNFYLSVNKVQGSVTLNDYNII